MARRACRNRRVANKTAAVPSAARTVITNRMNCCIPSGSTSEEMYTEITPEILMARCCDEVTGCKEFETERRNSFWPSFAHPRWLTCRELFSPSGQNRPKQTGRRTT